MTKNEYDLTRLQKQLMAIQDKVNAKQEAVNKEIDQIVIRAMRKINISREDGVKLARLISNKESFEAILKLDPEIEKRVVNKPKTKEVYESEDNDDED